MRLRTLLALLICTLLILTAGSIGWLGYTSSHRAVKRSTQREIAMINASAAHHVTDFLNDPANRLLNELTLRARRVMLKLSDDRALGFDLAERLRVNPTLAWISYSDATTGHFVGVWRDDTGDIVLNVQSPGELKAHEEIIYADGSMVSYPDTKPKKYDPRERAWFKNAAATDVTVWSPPYFFVDNVMGITASRAWRPASNGEVAGVFTVDFFLKDLEGLLDGVKNIDGFSAILASDGTLICSSQPPDSGALVAALIKWVRDNPNFKSMNEDGHVSSHLIPLQAAGTHYLAALDRVDAPSGLKCIVAGVVPRRVVFQDIDRVSGRIGEVALVAMVLAVLAGALVAYRVSAPLHALGDDLDAVGHFQLAGGNQPRSVVLEVNQLHAAADRMKSGLRSFIKYVPDDLVRQLLASGKEATLGGENRRLTIFFSDIEGFTSHSEKVTPDVLVGELADYFEILSRQLRQHSGTIDKFIGDGLLAFFNAPENVPQHQKQACRATLAALQELSTKKNPDGSCFRTRIGLHCGEVLVGNIGTPDRFAYTVLGDAVNAASRLEGLNKIYGTQVIASDAVRQETDDDFEWRHLDRVAVAGRLGSMEIHELMGRKGEGRRQNRDAYEQALTLYFARSFREAGEIFRRLAESGDKAAILMTIRCDHFLRAQLPVDWNGVFSHELK